MPWSLQSKLEFNTTEHNDKQDSFKKTLICTVQRVSHAFVKRVREILNRKKTVKKHRNPKYGCLNYMKTLPDMIICLKRAFLHQHVYHLQDSCGLVTCTKSLKGH